MAYIKLFVGELESVKRELKQHPEKIEYYKKYDILIGSTESLNYLRKKK